jgi:hypothetical protein
MSKLLMVLLVSFGMAAIAQAEDIQGQDETVINQQQHNFLGRRPYAKAPVAKQQSPEDKWEGASIVTDKPKGFDKHQQMRLNFMSKRPYVAESTPE